jgi:hypothetical protein
MSFLSDLLKNKGQLIAASSALLLHIAVSLLIVFTAKTSNSNTKIKETRVPVSLVQPLTSITEPTLSKSPISKYKKTPVKKRKHKKRRDPSKKPVKKSVVPDPPETVADTLDCSMFDEASCSPCLSDETTCKKCCSKKETPGTNPTNPVAKSDVACVGKSCTPKDPCTPDILKEMGSSFCPKVRRSVYAKLGRITISGISPDKPLFARVAVSISGSGVISLVSLRKSSKNSSFISGIKKAISTASRVLPPARITPCVVSRGCQFSVTIGAKRVKKIKSTIKIGDDKAKLTNKSENLNNKKRLKNDKTTK